MTKFRKRKLIKRFIKLDQLRREMEENGCLKRSCQSCSRLIKINTYYYTCMYCSYDEEMWNIYNILCPDDIGYKHTWVQKVNIIKKLYEEMLLRVK